VDAAGLKRVGSGGTDEPASADDGDFHVIHPFGSNPRPSGRGPGGNRAGFGKEALPGEQSPRRQFWIPSFPPVDNFFGSIADESLQWNRKQVPSNHNNCEGWCANGDRPRSDPSP